MILIISEKSDVSTVKVLYWLEKNRLPFLLWLPEQGFKLKEIRLNNFTKPSFIVQNEQTTIRSDEISAVWYRRGQINGLISLSKLIFIV